MLRQELREINWNYDFLLLKIARITPVPIAIMAQSIIRPKFGIIFSFFVNGDLFVLLFLEAQNQPHDTHNNGRHRNQDPSEISAEYQEPRVDDGVDCQLNANQNQRDSPNLGFHMSTSKLKTL